SKPRSIFSEIFGPEKNGAGAHPMAKSGPVAFSRSRVWMSSLRGIGDLARDAIDHARHAPMHLVCGTLTGAAEHLCDSARGLRERPEGGQEIAAQPDVIAAHHDIRDRRTGRRRQL